MPRIDLGKRRLLTSAAAMAASGVLPTWRRQALAADRYDAVIVGGGTAGMPAAIFAAERGRRVLLVEKAPLLGGTLDRSGAQTTAAGTVFQKKLGIKDTWQDHYNDIMRITRNTAEPILTKLWTQNAANSLNWLAGLGLKLVDGSPTTGGHEPLLIRRAHHPVDRARQVFRLMEPLVKKAEAAGKLEVLLGTKAVDLIMDDGAVVGLVIEDDTGAVRDVMAKNVVLTSGGCMANPRMFQELHGVPLHCMLGYPFNHGDGLILGQAAGGFLKGGDTYCPLLSHVLDDDQVPSKSIGAMIPETHEHPPWEVWVNTSGERFVAEDHPSKAHQERALGRQTAHRFWAVFDQEVLERSPPVMSGWTRAKYDEAFAGHPMFTKASSIHELGARAGLNPHVLGASLADYNRGIAEGRTDIFGREHRPVPIARPPFYAIQLHGYGLMSWAGLAADQNLQVLRRDRTPIKGLYAAGEVLGRGTFGDSYTNGSGVTPALTFGRLLGQRILNFEAA